MVKKIKIILMIMLIVVAVFSICIAAEAVIINNKKNYIQNNKSQHLLFDAEITFNIYEGEGCGCKPITGAYIIATGGEGSDYGYTDEDGKCTLTLVILGEYRVQIEAENYHIIIFNFNVVDDQTFSFHMQEKKDLSISTHPLIYHILRNIFDK